MSAFVVNKEHIDFLLTAGLNSQPWPLRWKDGTRELTPETADAVGTMLWGENVRSVNHRYAENAPPPLYRFEPFVGKIKAVAVLKAINCLDYQSCEHDGWGTSEAREFLNRLRDRVIGQLPG